MLALLLVAVSLGLSNFAASVGIGVSGVDARTRLRVGVIFGVFETAMPIIGLLAGRGLAQTLGRGAHWIGAALLIATGAYTLIQAIRADSQPDDPPASPDSAASLDSPDSAARPTGRRTWRLIITGAALSADNLAVGFALGTYHISLGAASLVVGAVSVTMSLTGLELGHRLGTRAGGRGELVGGLVLVGVGIAIAAGVL
jgi:manganese efflux pump family protein